MLLAEVRTVVNYSLEDYLKGQRYTHARSFKEENESNNRPAIIVENTESFTNKHFEISNLVPATTLLKPFISSDKLILIEKSHFDQVSSYNTYETPLLKSFKLNIYSYMLDQDIGETDDIFNRKDLKIPNCNVKPVKSSDVKLINLDFINYDLAGKSYDKDFDIKLNPKYSNGTVFDSDWLKRHKEDFKKSPEQ
ncbi:MAG: hypothetical protein MHPSP_000895, partial [Paramarteilia canceri]